MMQLSLIETAAAWGSRPATAVMNRKAQAGKAGISRVRIDFIQIQDAFQNFLKRVPVG
jgi:hypothetical protein